MLTKKELRTHVRTTLTAVYGNWEMMQRKYAAPANAETLALAFILTVGRVAGLMAIPQEKAERWFRGGYRQAVGDGPRESPDSYPDP